MKYCGNCGSPMQDMDNVCSQCGTPVDRNIRVYHQGMGTSSSRNDQAILGLVMSVGSLMFFAVPFIPVIFAIAGIVISVMGMKEADNGKGYKGIAIAGLVCGIIALIIGGLVTSCYTCMGCTICSAGNNTWV